MQDKSLVPQPEPEASGGVEILGAIAGELAPRSQQTYAGDARAFASWLQENGVTPETIDYETITRYRGYLVGKYAPATAKRMFSVARRLLDEQVRRGVLAANPAAKVKGIKAEDESPHIALIRAQANDLLAAIDRTTAKGKRDYAIVATLLYTGLRRFELAALTLADLTTEQGHYVLIVQAGKGRKRAIAKLRVEAWRAIQEYLEATERKFKPGSAPLFCQFRRGDTPVEAPITPMLVYRVVLASARLAELDAHLTPHGMRASFVTLSLEGGAKLEQVQIAARHSDPRTTERYWRRKNNLDDNAVDYIRL